MEFIPYGDSALLLNFTQHIDAETNKKVLGATRAIEQANIFGLRYCTPAYCSIVIGFDPTKIKYDLFAGLIKSVFNQKNIHQQNEKKQTLMIPVCYDPSFAIDLLTLSAELKISPKEIIQLHTSVTYRVFMLGFLPGFPYLGETDQRIACKRKSTPRKKVLARSVGLAGRQTGIYPVDAPGGWQIIGQTPVPVFDPQKSNPFLFAAGDTVQFYPVTATVFDSIKGEIKNGHFNFYQKYG